MNFYENDLRSRKLLVNEVQRLDMQKLNRMGVFRGQPNKLWTSTLTYGNREYGSIWFYLIEDSDGPVALRLNYKISNNYSEEKTGYDYEVSLVSTPCFFGGKRFWFVCPWQTGQNCVRQCRIIYLTPYNSRFACRECCALTYECRQKHRDFYFEYLEKPQARFEAAMKNLSSSSGKKRRRAGREIALMRRRFDDFERLSAVRFQKLMGQA